MFGEVYEKYFDQIFNYILRLTDDDNWPETYDLQKDMVDGSIESALRYCNVHAYPNTDSLAAAHHVSITSE